MQNRGIPRKKEREREIDAVENFAVKLELLAINPSVQVGTEDGYRRVMQKRILLLLAFARRLFDEEITEGDILYLTVFYFTLNFQVTSRSRTDLLIKSLIFFS